MSLNKILELAQDDDSTKEEIVEYVEDLIALRKSNIKHIITKADSIAQNVRIATLLVDTLDTITTVMETQFASLSFISPKAIKKLKVVTSTNKAFVAFNDKAFEKPKGNANSGILDYVDLTEEFQEMVFKWIDQVKLK